MAVNIDILSSLNEQQIMMLRLFKTPLANEDFQQIRRLAVKLLAHKLDLLTEQWEDEHNITPEVYDELAKGHFRSKK